MNEDVQSLIDEVKKQKEFFDRTRVKCGIIGMSGSGKSSLINAIAGKKIANVGSTEQTMEAQSFIHEGIEYVDLPGCGTEKWPKNSYVEDLSLDSYDCFIVVTSNRLYENDIYLFNEVQQKKGKPCFVIRNKIDIAINDEAHDNDLSEIETLEKIRKNLLDSLPSNIKIYLTSARRPDKWDFPTLLIDIGNSQVGLKRDKFYAGMASWSNEAIEKKKIVAKKIVSWSAITSAANGLNPIPLTDIAVDAGILLNMVNQINKIFGLTEEQLNYLERSIFDIKISTTYNTIKQNIFKFLARYAATEGIILILKSMGAKVIIKNVSKFLPFVGSIISAGIGYKMTIAFGEEYLSDAEKNAEALINEILKA